MDTLTTLLSQETTQRIGWVLVHFLWQGFAVMGLMWCVLKVLGKRSSAVAYAAALTGLVLMVASPVATYMVIGGSEEIAVSQAVVVEAPVAAAVQQSAPVRTIVFSAEPVAPMPQKSLRQIATERLEAALPYCVVGWIVGVAGLSLWYLGGWCQLQRLRRIGTKAVSAAVAEKTAELARLLGVRQAVRIAESALVQVPAVIGWLKPVILLPATALTGLDEMQLKAMIAHELAHIKRCDYLVNLAQTVVEILGFYHPAVWWMSRQIRVERENCCDDIAVGVLQNRKAYAKALFSMEEIRAKQLDLAVAANGAPLTDRIVRLIGGKAEPHPKSGWLPSAVAILLIALLIIPTALALSEGSKGRVDKKDDPRAEVIVQKVLALYSGMKSYSADGEVISDIDMSGVNIAGVSLPGKTDDNRQKLQENKEFQGALKKQQKFTHTFTIKLARPNLYCIEWEQKIHEAYSNIGAVWSSDGKTNFLFNAGRKTSPEDLHMALATATGVSGGVANTIPTIFFDEQANILRRLENMSIDGGEEIDGEQCYVVSGQLAYMTMKFWVSQKTLLIRQRQQILGGVSEIEMPNLSEEEIKESLQKSGQEVTPEAIKQTKELMKSASVMTSKLKGTITETHRNIMVNQPINPSAFIPNIDKEGDSDQIGLSPQLKNAQERAQELRRRADSLQKLKHLGPALMVYLNDHEEKYPERLDKAFAESVDMYYDDWLAQDVELLVAGENEKKERANQIPIAYDKALLKAQDGTTVLFADGHVEFVPKDKLKDFGIDWNLQGNPIKENSEPNMPPMLGGMGGFGGLRQEDKINFSDKSEIDQFLQKQLDTSIDLSPLKGGVPLSEAIDYIRNSVEPPLPIVVDWDELKEKGGILPTDRARPGSYTKAPIHDALRETLYYVSKDKSLQIRDIIRKEMYKDIPLSVEFVIENNQIFIKYNPYNLVRKTYTLRPGFKYDPVGSPSKADDLRDWIIKEIWPLIDPEQKQRKSRPIYPEISLEDDGILKVLTTENAHKEIAKKLNKLELLDLRQIAIESRFILVEDDTFLKEIGIEKADFKVGQVIEGLANSEAIMAAVKEMPLAERVLPFDNFPMLDDRQALWVSKGPVTAGQPQNVKTLTAPKVVVFNEEAACLEVQTELGYRDVDDTGKNITNGIIFDVLPILQDDGKEILFKGHVVMSDILGDRIQERDGKKYEIPYVQVTEIPVHTMVENGKSILIVGPQLTPAEDERETFKEKRRLLILIKPTIMKHEEQEMDAVGLIGGEKE